MKKLAATLVVLTPLVFASPVLAAVVDSRDDYATGIDTVRQAVAKRDFLHAEEVLTGLLSCYGESAELLTERGRVLFWQKRYAAALASLERARQLQPSGELDAEVRRVETARLVAEADLLVARGELLPAGALLARGFKGGDDRYETGIRLASVRNRQGRHREAAEVYATLMREYPADAELPLLYAGALSNSGERARALHFLQPLLRQGGDPRPHVAAGRILVQQGRLAEAREEYAEAKRLGGTPELPALRQEVEGALNFRHVQSLVAAGGYDLAAPLLRAMSAPGPYSREARLLSARVLLVQRRAAAAREEGSALYRDYPHDPEVAALYAEALEANGRGLEAQRVLDAAGGSAGATLRSEREDLWYRARVNWLRLTGEGFGYSNGTGSESGAGVTVSQRLCRLTAVASLVEITRFGLTDPQLALDLYLPRRAESRLSGALYLSAAPRSRFLPRYTAGGEVSYALRQVELSAGYNRLGFRADPADVLSAALVWYLPAAPVTLTEKVYVAAGSGSVLSVTTLGWEASHRLRLFFSGGAGNSSERRLASEDVKRYDTWLVRGGGEYRFSPAYSIGAEGSFESRRTLYDRYGGVLFLRYWWH